MGKFQMGGFKATCYTGALLPKFSRIIHLSIADTDLQVSVFITLFVIIFHPFVNILHHSFVPFHPLVEFFFFYIFIYLFFQLVLCLQIPYFASLSRCFASLCGLCI